MLWFDHVTSFVKDRHATASGLRDQGLHATEGGLHTGFGSANDLSYFGLFYLELLEITDPAEAASSGSEVCRYAVDFLQQGEGLATLALETDDLVTDVRRLRAAGYTVPEPIAMQRVHDDGFVSHSTIAYPASDTLAIRPPILIERSTKPDKRKDQLADREIIAPHPAGDIEVNYVAVAVPNAWLAARALASAYGITSDETLTPIPELGGEFCTVHLPRADLQFVQPVGPGAALEQLDRRGSGPFAIGVALSDVRHAHWAAREKGDVVDVAGISFVIQKIEVPA